MNEKQILNAEEMYRALKRIAGEIFERNEGLEHVMLIGICRRGVPLAQRIASILADIEGEKVPVGQLDISLYRDDIYIRGSVPMMYKTGIQTDITGRIVVLVDDVLYTGRTIRAALDGLADLGRPRCVQLAVLIDRGHREVPIRADFVGRNVPTTSSERVNVRLQEIDGKDDEVVIVSPDR